MYKHEVAVPFILNVTYLLRPLVTVPSFLLLSFLLLFGELLVFFHPTLVFIPLRDHEEFILLFDIRQSILDLFTNAFPSSCNLYECNDDRQQLLGTRDRVCCSKSRSP